MTESLPKRETLEIEFKSDVKKLNDSDLIDAIVAFANTNGGDLYLGIEDDGRVTGIHAQHRDITQLAAFIANKTVPPVSVLIEMHESEQPVLQIHVPKSRSIVASSSGKIQRRRLKADGSPENVPMYPYEIATRLSELSLLDFSAQPVPGASTRDLDPLERERLRRIILAYNGERSLLGLTDEEIDLALRLVVTTDSGPVPTYAGLLLIGKKNRLRELIPTAESAFVLMQGTDVLVNESAFQPLLEAIERLIDFVSVRNRAVEAEQGPFRISIPDYDPRAVREGIVNAFAHRDYTRLGRVLVRMDSDGLTISNPGGFIEGVTYQNILSVEPHGRNPALADALKRIGLAERSGRGVDRIYEGSLRFGRAMPSYLDSSSASVSLFIPKDAPDRNLTRVIAEEQRATGLPMSLNELMILNVLKDGTARTPAVINTVCHLPQAKLETTLRHLTESHLLNATGAESKRKYALRPGKPTVNRRSRSTGDDIRQQLKIVMEFVDEQGEVTRKDVMELLNVSAPQAYHLLRRLKEEGLLMAEGNTNAARYTRVQR